VALMLAMLALIHSYWATAGKESLRIVLRSAEVPIPPPWAVWLVAGLLVVGALLVLGRAGDWGGFVPPWMFVLGCWTMVVSFSGSPAGSVGRFRRLDGRVGVGSSRRG